MEGCQAGDRIIVETRDMAYGPHAVARYEGLVVFVRGAAPGECVEVRVRERKRNHAFADVVAIRRASEVRRVAACPLSGSCGGCPWQHLGYAHQLAEKRRIVSEQLQRVAGVDVVVSPVRPSPRVYGYRRRIKLRVEGKRVGYYAGGSHDLVEVGHCALAESEIDRCLPAVRRLVDQFSSNVRRIEMVARHGAERGVVVVGEIEGALAPGDETICRGWLESSDVCTGLFLRGRGWQRRWGQTRADVEVDDEPAVHFEAMGFSQVNPLANRDLVRTVVRLAGEVAERRVLDAYSGAGNLAAPLARRGAQVVAVEQSAEACESAEANAAAAARGWTIIRGRVEKVLFAMADRQDVFDVVVLDPPRSGAQGVVESILRMAPRVVIYVSCDPATLARDLKVLQTRYRLAAVEPIDMFPHTYHVETVVRCELTP